MSNGAHGSGTRGRITTLSPVGWKSFFEREDVIGVVNQIRCWDRKKNTGDIGYGPLSLQQVLVEDVRALSLKARESGLPSLEYPEMAQIVRAYIAAHDAELAERFDWAYQTLDAETERR